jgi:hypothetical protein
MFTLFGPVGRRLACTDHVQHQSELHAMFAISISGKRNKFANRELPGSCGDDLSASVKLPHFP